MNNWHIRVNQTYRWALPSGMNAIQFQVNPVSNITLLVLGPGSVLNPIGDRIHLDSSENDGSGDPSNPYPNNLWLNHRTTD